MTILKYPLELNENNLDYISFRSYKYRTNQSIPGSTVDGAYGPVEGNPIQLFMPTSTPAIGNANNWGPESFDGPIGKFKRDAAAGAASIIDSFGGSDTLDATVSTIVEAFNKGVNGIGDTVKHAALNYVTQHMGTTPNTALALARGKIYNPNIELIYQGPSLRGYDFSFIFLPKSAREAEIVNQIIMEFKKWSSPKTSGGMFEIPNVWEVRYMSGGGLNKNMNAFKKSALTSINVQANAGLDMHMSYENGMPITTTMTLQFTEVDIITRDDHAKSGTNQGY